jgi:hypothetical protein
MLYLKTLSIILLILYILLFLYIYKNIYYKVENFTGILETISNLIDNKDIILNKNNIENKIENKKNEIYAKEYKKTKYIYLSNFLIKNTKDKNTLDIKNIENTKEKFTKYYLYNKNNENYMKIIGKINDYDKKIEIKDINNNIIGEFLNEKYTIIKFNLNFYKNNIINIEYKNNYQSVKIYLDDDDKIFYIIYKKNKYYIYLFNNLEIGIINQDQNIYKIIVYEEYKIYLNLFALGLIILFYD